MAGPGHRPVPDNRRRLSHVPLATAPEIGARLRDCRAYLRRNVRSDELQRPLKHLELCLPRPAKAPPAGPGWIHEIKHDGFRILAGRDVAGVTLHTHRGYDFADRFPLAAAAVAKPPVKSCLIDGEAIVCDANRPAVFDLLRRRWRGELDGRDLRLAAVEERKSALAKLLRELPDGITFNEHYSGDGAIIYRPRVRAGLRGDVSKPLTAAPAVRREAEEDWDEKRRRR
jgi:bifunctional non-homologous end joining protein LigD